MKLFEIDDASLASLIAVQSGYINKGDILGFYKTAKKLFYRGMESNSEPFITAEPRSDRRPKNTSDALTKFCDLYLTKKGFVANRTNSFFVTSHLNTAKSYGNPYIVFPIGRTEFTWSPLINDYTLFMEDDALELGYDRLPNNLADIYKNYEYADQTKELNNDDLKIWFEDNWTIILETNPIVQQWFLTEIMPRTQYTNGDLLQALTSENEVMIKNKCIFVEYNYAIKTNLLSKLKLEW